MGKSSKKSKHINIGNDFKKQKLKAGKKKPSANATKTTFKSRSIFITEQLKTHSANELLSYSKQSLPELFSHLNHYSASFRSRAIMGIKEIVQNTAIGTIDPGLVVQKISKSILDEECEVRRTSVSLLRLLFDKIPEDKMTPHFPLVLSHLYCAMSHISIKVQKDSLKVVELFLKYYPNLIRSHAGTKLLHFFLELISVKESGGNSTGRILATTLALKNESVIHWRVRVLSQILTLLQILSLEDATIDSEQAEHLCFWNVGNILLKLLPNQNKQRGISLESIQRKSVVSFDEPTWKELMAITFPILVQCWVEVAAFSVLEKDIETVQTMIIVLSITFMFCKNVTKDFKNSPDQIFWLRNLYLPSFTKHFFNNFPFELPDSTNQKSSSRRKKETTVIAKQSDFEHINLLICNLCAFLTSNVNTSEDNERIHITLDYLADYLESCLSAPFVENDFVDLALSCLQRLFCLNSVQAVGDTVLSNLYKYCYSSKCTRVNRGKIMQFMMELYENYPLLEGKTGIETLLADLPSHFAKILKDCAPRPHDACNFQRSDNLIEYLVAVLKCMQCAHRRKSPHFLKNISNFLSKILVTFDRNYETLFCPSESTCVSCLQFQNTAFGCLLSQLPNISETDFTTLTSFCCNPIVYLQCRTFIVETLLLKALPTENIISVSFNKAEVELFLKFLFTILTISRDKNKEIANALSRHEIISDHICNSLRQLSEFWPDLWQVQAAFLKKKLKVISTSAKSETVIGLFKLGCSITRQTHVEVDFRGIGRFLAAFSLLSVKQSKEWDTCIKACVIHLLSFHQIMEAYICVLLKSDSSLGALSLTNLLEITELQEYYKFFSSEILSYVANLKKSDDFEDLRKLKSIASAMLAEV